MTSSIVQELPSHMLRDTRRRKSRGRKGIMTSLKGLHIAAGSTRLHGSQLSWQISIVQSVVVAGGPDQSDRSGQTALQLLQKTITLGSSMDEASSNVAEQHRKVFLSSLQVSNAEQCTQLLRRHGAEPCAWVLEICAKVVLRCCRNDAQRF